MDSQHFEREALSPGKPGEGLEVNAVTLLSDGHQSRWAPIRLTVKNGRVVWSLVERRMEPIAINLADVILAEFVEEDQAWKLMTQPADYPTELLKFNPAGVLECVLGHLPYDIAALIDDGLDHSRGVLAQESQVERMSHAIHTDLTQLGECPQCGGFIRSRSANGIECHICNLIFTNQGVRPKIDWTEDEQWRVVGEQSWFPIFEGDLKFADSNLIWAMPPRPGLPGPILAYQLVLGALGIAEDAAD